jgi:hypothetical protein
MHASGRVQAFYFRSDDYGAGGIRDASQQRAPGFLAAQRKLHGAEENCGDENTFSLVES